MKHKQAYLTSDALKAWRLKYDLSIEQTAALLGLSISWYMNLERGKVRGADKACTVSKSIALNLMMFSEWMTQGISYQDALNASEDPIAHLDALNAPPAYKAVKQPKQQPAKADAYKAPAAADLPAKPKFTYDRDVAEIRSNARIPEEIKQMAMRVEYE